MPTQQQLDARLNPSAFTVSLPPEGTVFRASGDNMGTTLWKVENGKLVNLSTPIFITNTRVSYNGKVYEPGSVVPTDRDLKVLDPNFRGNVTQTTTTAKVYEQKNGAGSY